MKLSVVIPVYNEEQTVREVIERVLAVDLGSMDREILVVDDGSTDETARIVRDAGLAFPERVRVYHAPINLGKGAAVRMGFAQATGDIVIVQDADAELNPDEYHRLLQPILDGRAEVVYGSRFAGRAVGIPFMTHLANGFLTIVTNILFLTWLTDMETAYKVMRRSTLARIRLRCVAFDFEAEITAKLLLAGCKIVEVPISYNPRRANEGKKIRWTDGLDALYTLVRCRLVGKRDVKDRVSRSHGAVE
jgi:glycosyltransferase involved in cell wall biosynthesis